MNGYIYLIHVREFININEQTYKIGRTEDLSQRCHGYPKNSEIIYSRKVNDEINLEKLIIAQFKIDYIQQQQYGTEYFTGDSDQMINTINMIIEKYDNITIKPVKNNVQLFNESKVHIKNLLELLNQEQNIKNNYNKAKMDSYDSNYISEQKIEYKQKLLQLHKDIDLLTLGLNELIYDVTPMIDGQVKGLCEFEGHCDLCTESTIKIFCSEKCEKCHIFREEQKKEFTKTTRQYYKENILKQDYTDVSKQPNLTHITNYNTININNLNITVKDYIKTKDSIFNVIITSLHEKAGEKLRYVFTFLMCGINGKKIFPDEPKHSKAVTYQVVAASYNITNEQTLYTLYGVLRYKYHVKNTMTIKKLESMGDQYVTVKAICPEIWDNHKYHISTTDVDDIMINIVDNFKGSNFNDFYLED